MSRDDSAAASDSLSRSVSQAGTNCITYPIGRGLSVQFLGTEESGDRGLSGCSAAVPLCCMLPFRDEDESKSSLPRNELGLLWCYSPA
jgi:hypothetical protein